jgi:hypothetical protein
MTPNNRPPRLQAVDWSKNKISAFKKAYAEGGVDTEVMSNLLARHSDIKSVHGLTLLTVPLLEPTHFHFTGNRPYQMQVVSNGESFGVFSHERVPPKRRSEPGINIVRLEVVVASNLPFLKVDHPDERQLRTLFADWLEWTVQGFDRAIFNLPEDAVDFCRSLSRPLGFQTDPLREKIERGEDPREVLSAWISAEIPPAASRPRPR